MPARVPRRQSDAFVRLAWICSVSHWYCLAERVTCDRAGELIYAAFVSGENATLDCSFCKRVEVFAYVLGGQAFGFEM